MRATTAIAIFVVTAFAASMSFDAPAKAGQVHPVKTVGKTVNSAAKGVSRSVNTAAKTVSKSARWGARTVWVGAGVGEGAAVLTHNCNYYHKRYRETRSAEWRNKYNACVR